MTRPVPHARAAYPYHHPTPTRWADNDVYGHVNNVTYYSYFDTAVNAYLAARGALDVQGGAVIGLVVETGCAFFAPAAFPDLLSVGVRVAQLGRSSVRYELAIFREGEAAACAQGHFVHVYVDRATRRPVALPPALRAALAPLAVGEAG
ncbi:acyl-CoA thioesterase [Deinococcus budaensis]|uniref:Acyl-CoA thioester hydrolase n=1 Tax=Deinococcus budaensis TaxID=1665626 RepID=A0A7W8LRQ8_9DEIO|nr:thioesterase family protein [Deinococcus budaensis]MBB5236151.1 acyl-CoA thioester hydrolase [Deinococcus budaensis]